MIKPSPGGRDGRKDVDAYIAKASKPSQAMLKTIRAAIKTAAPQAEEKISYGIVGYFRHGRLVSFGAFENHISFYGWGRVMKTLAKQVKRYQTSVGTLQFPIGSTVPTALITRLVKARIQENKARAKAK
ncbi:MAG: DUF1801 domain-containing protein [Candidatus Kerfeldbacteria bacterium]|nr:DUF1801 domain-containing protein [Candidatus Kerfeldbacteria bacterium]